MIDVRDIYSLTDFQRNTRRHIRRLRRTGRPAVLTVNGAAELVVQDAEAYQRRASEVDAVGPRTEMRISLDLPREADPVIEAYKEHIDRTLLRENLARSPEERVRGLMALQRLADEAARAGRRATAGRS